MRQKKKMSWKQINFALSSALSGRRECWKIVSRYRLRKATNFGSTVEIWVIVRLGKVCVGDKIKCTSVHVCLCVCVCVCERESKRMREIELFWVGFQVWLLVNAECYPNMPGGQSSGSGNWILNKTLVMLLGTRGVKVPFGTKLTMQTAIIAVKRATPFIWEQRTLGFVCVPMGRNRFSGFPFRKDFKKPFLKFKTIRITFPLLSKRKVE